MLLFLFVSLVSVVILLVNLGAIYHSKWYLPLQLKSSTLDRCLAAAALIHLWSALISYDTEKEFHSLRVIDCSLWSYWLQLFFGLQAWVLVIIFRILQHRPPIEKEKLLKLCIVAVSAIPLGILCAIVPIEYKDGVCTTPLPWKIPIFVWSFLALGSVSVLGFVVYRKSTKTRNFKALRDCILAALFVLVSVILLHFFGVLPELVVVLIAFLHLFVTLRIFSFTLYKAMRHDENYVESFFLKEGESQTVEHRSTTSLARDPQRMNHFIDWVFKQGHRDTVDFYESVFDILIKTRESRDTTEEWIDLKQRFPYEFIPGEEQPIEKLYEIVLARLETEFGDEYFSKGIHTPVSCGSILDESTNESVELEAYLSTTTTDEDEVVYADLGDFKE